MRFFNGIMPKILLPVILFSIILVGTTLVMSTIAFQRYVEHSITKEIKVIGRDLNHELSIMHDMALIQVEQLAEADSLIHATTNNDREKIGRIFEYFQSTNKCEFFTLVDAKGNVIFRTSSPENYGDSQLQLQSIKDVMANHKSNVGFESTPKVRLAIRAAAPVFNENDELIGVLSGGFRFDSNRWVDAMKDYLNVDCTIFLKDERISTTLIKDDGNRAVGTKLNNPPVEESIFVKKSDFNANTMVLGRMMKVIYSPLIDRNGNAIGILFAGIPTEYQTSIIRNNIMTNILITTIGLIVFVSIVFFVVRRIVVPVQNMTRVAKDLSDGNLDINIKIETGDELQVLAQSVQHIAGSLKEKTAVALSIAKGDLTTWVPLTSEKDTLGTALIAMRYGLYDSIKDLSSLATTVSNEGNQVSESNKILVQNTKDSADQLREIVEAIDSLTSQTELNSQNAIEADQLALRAKNASIDGKQKMDRMVQSMDDISQSANQIKNIIRVIEDIAFQTNLLALNAAVEAARAGTHGKGFAVVAEEVRSLAARSAKAAKETTALIEETIRQVSNGSNVVHETSDSLHEITGHSEEVSALISKISQESAKQAEGFGKVNVSVTNVSEVAAMNTESATEVSNAVLSIADSAQSLEKITKNFKYNQGGKVSIPEGVKPQQVATRTAPDKNKTPKHPMQTLNR